MSTVLEAVGTLIAQNNLGVLGTTLFLGRMPETPDQCIAVHEYEGQVPEFTMGLSIAVDKPRIQVMTRAAREDYPTARDLAVNVRNTLAGIAPQTVNGISILRLAPAASIMPMGPDGTDRPRFVINFDVWVLP